jgi:copper chaperone NosL
LGEEESMSGRLNNLVYVAALLPIVLAAPSLFLPMWNFWLNAPLYGQKWLEVTVHPLTGVSGDVEEVNIVNHYVGLGPVGNDHIPEIVYMPYVYAAYIAVTVLSATTLFLRKRKLALLFLVIGLVLVASIYVYVYMWLYRYTHTIMPGAAVKIEPFDPPYIGEHKIANFVVRSYPGPSLILLTLSSIIGLLLSIRKKP